MGRKPTGLGQTLSCKFFASATETFSAEKVIGLKFSKFVMVFVVVSLMVFFDSASEIRKIPVITTAMPIPITTKNNSNREKCIVCKDAKMHIGFD